LLFLLLLLMSFSKASQQKVKKGILIMFTHELQIYLRKHAVILCLLLCRPFGFVSLLLCVIVALSSLAAAMRINNKPHSTFCDTIVKFSHV